MGKRELLLAGVIVLVGFLVYQVTAPPGDPNKPGFSFSRILNEVRREVRGQREFAEDTKHITIPVTETVREIRLDELSSTQLTVVGEDRRDIAAEFYVRSNGYDQAEARRLVDATTLASDEAGALLIMRTSYPVEGRQTGRLTLRVPSRLGFRTDGKSGVLKISNIASVAIGTARGDTELSDIKGHLAVTQRGSRITIQNVGSVRLQAISADTRLSGVRGDTTLNLQGGEFTAEQLLGGLEVESRNSEMRFEKIDELHGPVRFNATLGELTIRGLATESRIDARDTQIRIELAAAVPLGIYNTGDDIDVTLPAAGVDIDAVSVDGAVTLDESLQKAALKTVEGPDAPGQAGSRDETRVSGAVAGGGPMITLRATRGDIILKSK